MAGINSRVENICTRPRASARVVRVARGSRLGAGQAGEAPWGVLLDSEHCDRSVLLYIVDLRKNGQFSIKTRRFARREGQRGRDQLLRRVP